MASDQFLDKVHEFISEDSWDEGLDVYRGGHILKVQAFGDLVTSKIASTYRQPAEVRIKIQPERKCIQWIECTCKYNRTSGLYCEHIAATLIHIDRENPEIIKKLNPTMPLIPPPSWNKSRVKSTLTNKAVQAEQESAVEAKSAQATQMIFQRFSSHIESAKFIGDGPSVQVRIELKPGHLTQYDLPIDQAAKFILEHRESPFLDKELKKIFVSESAAVDFGTKIYEQKSEVIVAERVVGLLSDESVYKKVVASKLFQKAESFRKISRGLESTKYDSWFFQNLESIKNNIGKEYLFIPKVGFFKIQTASVAEGWNDLALKTEFKYDEAVEFIEDNFRDYMKLGTVWLDESFRDLAIVNRIDLSQIQVLDEHEGWFKLDPTFGDGEFSISMVELITAYRKRKRKYLKIKNKWIRIPESVKSDTWKLKKSGPSSVADENALEIDALGLMRLRASMGDMDSFVGSKNLLNQIRKKIEFSEESDIPSLEDTSLTLRAYQTAGVKWLWWLYQNHLHGLLADEMGLGKTHQAMGLMSLIRSQKLNPENKNYGTPTKFLVVCPTTVIQHWQDKIERFAPLLKPRTYHGSKRSVDLKNLGSDTLTIVTSYGIIMRDIEALSKEHFDAIIFDEAHYIKNAQTATYQAACLLKGRMRLCMSGTPLENYIIELKSIFDFLLPGYLGSDEYFRREFVRPLTDETGKEHGKVEKLETEVTLQRLIHPFKLRRTKNLVLKDLPDKVEDIKYTELSDLQMTMYRDTIALKAQPILDEMKKDGTVIPYLHVFAILTLLKQICNHPALLMDVNKYEEVTSGKFELLKELIQEAMGSDHKVVIYSQYLDMLKIISNYLTTQKIDHAVLTGASRNRGDIINRFQNDPECKVFCASLLAGGVGIDLTSASVVIHYDRWWNSSKENQATDRVHRIGQNKNVQVYKFITKGTLEEKIHSMIESKRKLIETFMDKDEEMFKSFSRQDLIQLLQ